MTKIKKNVKTFFYIYDYHYYYYYYYNTDIDMGKEVVELTVGALGGDSVREFGGFTHTDLVLGTDPQHVLVAGDQADDAELGSRVGGRADRHVHRLGRVALLHDVPAIHTLLS